MVLVNAKRQEARSVVLTVEGGNARIDMLLLDGSSTPLIAPPAEVLLGIIAGLDKGEREFSSNVYETNVQEVTIQRGTDSTRAQISRWDVGHCEE
jgi:hypothetical protein